MPLKINSNSEPGKESGEVGVGVGLWYRWENGETLIKINYAHKRNNQIM